MDVAPLDRGIMELFPLLATSVILLVLILCSRILRIESDSMAPTLQVGDRILAIKGLRQLARRQLARPRRGAVVVLRSSQVVGDRAPTTHVQQARTIVKRVVAVGGDMIDFGGEYIVVNGAALLITPVSAEQRPLRLLMPTDGLFVVGDHQAVSYDSRNYGPVRMESVVGVARAIVWPPRRVRYLRPSSPMVQKRPYGAETTRDWVSD